MKIINKHNPKKNWITCEIEGRLVEAKVFDKSSCFGVNNGRVSKLAISKTDGIDSENDFLSQMDYHYERGLDFDNLPAGVLDKVIAELESLPKLFA